MELCTQCNRPESEHTRRVFGHSFKRPQPAEDQNPGYAGDLVDALSGLSEGGLSDSATGESGCAEAGGGDGGGCDAE